MRIGRKAIVGAAIAATAAGTMMVAAPKAMATPSNCTISYPMGYYQVASVCTSGTGYQEIDVVMSQGQWRSECGHGQLRRHRAGFRSPCALARHPLRLCLQEQFERLFIRRVRAR